MEDRKMKRLILSVCLAIVLSGCARKATTIQSEMDVSRDLISGVTTFTESVQDENGIHVNVFVHNPLGYPLEVFELKNESLKEGKK
jgi:outer membrane lipoprotein-sorting protein